MLIKLNQTQIKELLKKNNGSGGFQSLIKTLQSNVDTTNQTLKLNRDTLEKILRYADDYKNGGWQSRLDKIFDL